RLRASALVAARTAVHYQVPPWRWVVRPRLGGQRHTPAHGTTLADERRSPCPLLGGNIVERAELIGRPPLAPVAQGGEKLFDLRFGQITVGRHSVPPYLSL